MVLFAYSFDGHNNDIATEFTLVKQYGVCTKFQICLMATISYLCILFVELYLSWKNIEWQNYKLGKNKHQLYKIKLDTTHLLHAKCVNQGIIGIKYNTIQSVAAMKQIKTSVLLTKSASCDGSSTISPWKASIDESDPVEIIDSLELLMDALESSSSALIMEGLLESLAVMP